MISLDTLRLALIAMLVILIQLAFATALPEWRAGADPYILFLLLVTASRGPVHGGVFALAGGAVMDSFSAQLPAFHVLFYLLPAAAAVLMRSGMLLNYSQLASMLVAALLLAKVLLQFLVGRAAGWLDNASPLLHVNYISILLMALITLITWTRLGQIVAPGAESNRNV